MNTLSVRAGHAPTIDRTRCRITGVAERGAALVELALILPLLITVMAGATDFARVFYTANVLTNAARAGAQFCAQAPAIAATAPCTTTYPAIVQDIATANGLGTLSPTPTATRLCQCADATGATFSNTSPTVNDCSNACPGNHLVVRVTVTAAKTFSTVFATIPGIPATINLTRSATIRAR